MRYYTLILGILISLSVQGCQGAAVQDSLGHAVVLNRQAGSSTPPRVSAEFQAEVAQLAGEGLKLKEAVEVNLGEGSRLLAAIFEHARPKEQSKAFEFRMIESDGRRAATVFSRSEFLFSFDPAGKLAELNGTDINRDGLKEIIVQSSSGGNCWGCNPTEIYHVRNHKGELVAAGPIQKIADLNNDGVAELIVTDARWEFYEDLSHAASPSPSMVYAWKNNAYVYASGDFPAFYKTELTELHASLEEARAQITTDDFSDEAYLGLAISIAITYAHMGEAGRGIKEMEALMSLNARTPDQSRRRKLILDDFRSGESSRKLRQTKPGPTLQ